MRVAVDTSSIDDATDACNNLSNIHPRWDKTAHRNTPNAARQVGPGLDPGRVGVVAPRSRSSIATGLDSMEWVAYGPGSSPGPSSAGHAPGSRPRRGEGPGREPGDVC